MSDGLPRYNAMGIRYVIPSKKGDLCFYDDAMRKIRELEDKIGDLEQEWHELNESGIFDEEE